MRAQAAELTLRLRDGRTLGYADWGDRAGRPVLFFHGMPSSRLARHPDESIARSLGVRLITVDRPGIGLSSPKPRRRIVDWPADAAGLADGLGLDRFAVLGWSGGGPYALACAHALGARVTAVGLVGAVAPLAGNLDHLSPDLRRRARIARLAPILALPAIWNWERRVRRDGERFLEEEFAAAPECDRRVLDDPALRAMLLENRLEVCRPGRAGLWHDAVLLTRPWGFPLERIEHEVLLWHGERDESVRPEMGRILAAALPRCRVTLYPDEGHMVCLTRWGEILRTLSA